MASIVKLCGVLCIKHLRGSEHLNYKKHSLVRALDRFHAYYHVRRILKRLQVSLPHEASFNAADNPYANEKFLKICEDYGVSHNPTKNFIRNISEVLDGQTQ